MATTKTPKPTLPTAAASTPAEDTEPLAAAIPPDAVPPSGLGVDPEPETPADTAPPCDADGNTELHTPAKSGKGSTKGAAIEGHTLETCLEQIRPAITPHHVQLVSHIYPDGSCEPVTTTPPRVVIASRVISALMQQPRFVQRIVGKPEERQEGIAYLVSSALNITDELLRQAAADAFRTLPGDPEAVEGGNSEE